MQFTIERSSFLECVKEALVFSASRSTIECHTGILLEAKPAGEVLLKSTDGSAFAVIKVDTLLTGNDTALLSGKRLASMLSAMSGDTLTVSSNNDDDPVEIRDDTTVFKISRMDREGFPDIEVEKLDYYASTTCEELKTAVKSTSWSVCKDETRPRMCGLRFSCADGKSNVIATDGYTAACHFLTDTCTENTCGFTLSEKYSRMISSVLGTGTCEISMNETHAVFMTGSISVRVPVLENKFPDTSRILAATGDNVANVPRSGILPVLDRALIVSEDNGHVFNGLKISFSANKMETSIKSSFGCVNEEYVTDYTGENTAILVNPRYIQQAVSCCGDDDVEIRIRGSNAPIRVADTRNTMIISVMRL